MSKLDELEMLIRAIGLNYRKHGDSILVEYVDRKYGNIGIVVQYDEASDTVRIAAPLDVEPYEEALRLLLEENFSSQTYKYAIDYEGFITIVYDLPRKCIRTARDLREAIIEVIEGAKKVLERSEEPKEPNKVSPSSTLSHSS